MNHPKIQAWREEREIVIACLKSLADQLDKFHSNANQAGIAGSAVGVGGTMVGLTAAAVAPFCGGVSLIPGVLIASGSGIVGTATKLVGDALEENKKKKVFNDVESLLKEDDRCTKDIQVIAKRLDDAEESVQKYLTDLVMQDLTAIGQSRDGPTNQQETYRYPGPGGAQSLHKSVLPASKPGAGIDADQMVHYFQEGLTLARQYNLINIKQIMQVGKTFVKDGAKASKGALKAVKIGKVAKVGGIVVAVILLPIEVHELLTHVKDWKDGKGHPSTKEILAHAQKLQDGIDTVEKKLYGQLSAINNLVLLIKYMKNQGCPDALNSIINNILKRLLIIKDVVSAFDKDGSAASDCVSPPAGDEDISGLLVNYTDVSSSIFKELAVMLWVTWQMGSKSFAFLQNTAFTTTPALWTVFGVSLNSFGKDSGQGVSVLLPHVFEGDIISHHEFPDAVEQSDWHGRCLLVNISIHDKLYTLVNMLAPEEQTDRDLFLQETSAFIRKYSEGLIIIAANFQLEVLTMTIHVKKQKVCPNSPWPVMEKFLPYREIAEYLQHFHPFDADEPGMRVHQVCKDFTVGDPQLIFIDWKQCGKPQVSKEKRASQINKVMDLGLCDLWNTKNPGTVEYSMEKRISKECASCSKSIEFFIASELLQQIKSCTLDHDLRFLAFTKESVLKFGRTQ